MAKRTDRDANQQQDSGAGRAGREARSGPVRMPANEIENGGNIARSGSGERADHSVLKNDTATATPRPGAKLASLGQRTGPTAKRNAASTPRES